MKTGTVKFFKSDLGWGFIKEDECDAEWFVHVSGTYDKIKENDSVTFDEGEGRNGRIIAINVRRKKE